MKKASKLNVAQRYGVLTGAWKKRTTLINMLRAMWRKQYRASWTTRLALIIALVYMISPIDIIPDFIPFLGWMDDGAILFFLLSRLLTESEKFERWLSQFPVIKHGSRLPAQTD